MAAPRPLASIVIVTYGQRELTEQCLRSLERCLGDRLGSEWELVLIDNASPDDTPALLRRWSARAIVRLLEENRNFAGGCNAGAAEAHGEVLVFLNNDTEVTPGALETVVEQAREPGVAAAGCRLLFPQGTVQHAGVAFLRGRALERAAMGQHVFHHQDQELPATRACYELDCVTAACMAVRASAFRAVGGFDEEFRNGLEDVDLCLRLRTAGERIVYRGDVDVVHHEGASRGRGDQLWATPERIAAMHHNDLHFTGRWRDHLDQDDELALRMWDAALQDTPPPRDATVAEVVVQGQPAGIGAAADEARAWLAAFEAHGDYPAAADWPVPTVVPRMSEPAAALLERAKRRAPVANACFLTIPSGAHDFHAVGPQVIVRLARARTAVPLDDASAVWASCPAVAEALIDHGLRAEKIVVVLPPVLSATPGPGGEGVLVVLPVHDAPATSAILAGLRTLPASVPIRLLPTVLTRHLDRHVHDELPRAELLGPCSDEARFEAMAATADVVLALDGTDRFERRALVAAGTGAAPLTRTARGPAGAVVGAPALGEPHALGAEVEKLLADPGDRAERSERVLRMCGSEAIAPYLELRSRVAGLAAAVARERSRPPARSAHTVRS